ncbi:MAG: hypothetical protein RL510_430 [Actinomycetota bacterium]|jgi:pimeloyl-ACP methyl ester carboxylesterase
MKKFRKFMVRALIAGVLAFLIVPFLLPQPNSGTLTNREAAGTNSEFVTLANLDVHMERRQYTGNCNCEAPLIVLMHGFGASTFSWREVIEPLGKYGEVIAYDRPAFGLTERPTEWAQVNPYGLEGNFAILDNLLTKYGQNRQVVLVGHSAGGQLAAEYARLNPKKVSGLVLVDPAILTTGGDSSGLSWLYGIPQIQRLGPILVSSISSSGENVIRESFYDQTKVTQAVLDGYRQPLKVKGWELAFWNFVTAPRDNQLKENLSNLKTPTLLITGSNDTIVPTADTIKLDGLIPNSSLVVIPKSGHLPHEEQPEAFMKAFEAQFNSLLG